MEQHRRKGQNLVRWKDKNVTPVFREEVKSVEKKGIHYKITGHSCIMDCIFTLFSIVPAGHIQTARICVPMYSLDIY